MEQIKVSINVTLDLSESAKQFFSGLFEGKKTMHAEIVDAKPAQIEKPSPVLHPVKPTTTAAPAPAAEPAKEVTAPSADITLAMVREALKAKVNAHRDEIKAKLTELGAPSCTKLDESKYTEMYTFLINLK